MKAYASSYFGEIFTNTPLIVKQYPGINASFEIKKNIRRWWDGKVESEGLTSSSSKLDSAIACETQSKNLTIKKVRKVLQQMLRQNIKNTNKQAIH
jgi:hypothetical protein